MHQKKQNLLVLATVLLSVLIAFYLFATSHFPSASIAFVFLYLNALVYFVKQEKTNYHRILFLLILVTCAFLLIRSSPIVIALNIGSIIFLGSTLSITTKTEDRLINIITSPMLAILQTIREGNSFSLKPVSSADPKKEKSREKVIETVLVAIISLVTFVVIGALLGSANQQLGNLLSAILEFLNLEGLLNLIGSYFRLDRIIAAAFFCIMTLKYLSLVHANKALPKPHAALNRELDLRTPLLIACALITLFFIFQVDSHFASTESLSKQTNDIFAQLSAVCVIVFILLINNKTKDKNYNVIKTVLYFQLFYLIFLALRSDLTYIREWGLTHKRLYGLVVITWIVGMYSLYFKYMDRSQSVKKFYEYGIVFTSCLLIGVNLLNFDSLIYRFKPSTHTRPIDHAYLAGLSADSNYHFEHFEELKQLQPSTIGLDMEWSFITQLQEKYSTPDIRTFNLSEYLQYKKIKNIYYNRSLSNPYNLRLE